MTTATIKTIIARIAGVKKTKVALYKQEDGSLFVNVQVQNGVCQFTLTPHILGLGEEGIQYAYKYL